MALVHPRAPQRSPGLGPSGGPTRADLRSRPGAPARPRILGRPRFEALRALTLTPLDEARALDARAFAELPLPTVLELEVPGVPGPVWLRSAPGRGIAIGDPVLDGPAWRALVEAVESDRVRPVDFRHLVEKLRSCSPGSESALAREEIVRLLDGVPPDTRGWSVGRVLERLGARLFSVRIEEEPQDRAANGPVLQQAG